MAAKRPKLYYLRHLFYLFVEPIDIIDRLPSDTGIFTSVGDQIREAAADSDDARRNRVDIFFDWFDEVDSSNGNKFQELVDILKKGFADNRYKWLVPMLTECKNLDEEFLECFERVKKSDDVKYILQHFFLPLAEVCNVEDIIRCMRWHLPASDREEIEKIVEVQSNRRALYVLLNKLICKKPTWIDAFINAIEQLNYGLGSHMFEGNGTYGNLADALKDYFGLFGEQEESMEITEDVEPMNQSSLKSVNGSKLYSGKVPALLDSGKNEKEPGVEADATKSEEIQPAEGKGIKLRKYQEELCKNAINGENVVICAPTGSGKTIVAASIIERHLTPNNNGKVAFFTPTGGLAEQQFEKMKNYLPEKKDKVVMLHGSMDGGSCEDFSRKIYSSDIVVMTPKILLNCIENKRVKSLSDFSLMVFDECHHARASHPYSEILRKYLEESNNERTVQIIGLTATLGIGSAEDGETATEHIFKLLGILNATGGVDSVKMHKDELNEKCPTPREETIYITRDVGECDPFKQVIQDAVEQIVHILEEVDAFTALAVPKPNVGLECLNKEFAAWCRKLRLAVEGKIELKHYDPAGEDGKLSKTLGRDTNTCANTLECLIRGYDLCENCQPSDVIEEISRFDKQRLLEHKEKNTELENRLHDLLDDTVKKLHELLVDAGNKLLELLEERIIQKRTEDHDIRCMIMVSRRLYAMCLKQWVNDSPLLKELQGDIYIGVGTKSTSDMPGMTHKKQSKVIDRFKKGDIKVLVCTPDAAGEGIDIAECNLVVTVDCVKDEIRKVQLSGRARKEGSEVLHIYLKYEETERDKLSVKKQLLMEKTTREIMKRHRMENNLYREQLRKGRIEAIRNMKEAEEKKRRGPEPQAGRKDLFLCRTCSVVVCYTDQIIRMKGYNYMVNDPLFRRKYSTATHQSRGQVCWKKKDMRFVNRILCGNCKREWGNEVAWGEYLVPILGIKGFKIVDRREKVHCPSKWKNTRLRICEVEFNSDHCKFLFEKFNPDDMGQTSSSENYDSMEVSIDGAAGNGV